MQVTKRTVSASKCTKNHFGGLSPPGPAGSVHKDPLAEFRGWEEGKREEKGGVWKEGREKKRKGKGGEGREGKGEEVAPYWFLKVSAYGDKYEKSKFIARFWMQTLNKNNNNSSHNNNNKADDDEDDDVHDDDNLFLIYLNIVSKHKKIAEDKMPEP